MRLEVLDGERTIQVEVAESRGKLELRFNGEILACDSARIAAGHYSIVLDGKVHDLSVQMDREECRVSGRSGALTFRIRDPRRLDAQAGLDHGHHGTRSIVADMPGKVIRVFVREGESIENNQSLLILEAMKMQNEIRAPKAGVVKQIGVREGSTVEGGAFLLCIE
jgi:biotin carboxyl carrier protein